MKKIVALVLSLVMALALCTTAFAAVKDGDVFSDNMEAGKGTEYTYYAATEYKAGANNKLAFLADEDEVWYYVGGDTKLYAAGGTVADITLGKAIAAEGDITYNFKADKCGEQKWSCTTDAHPAGYTYKDANGKTQYAVDAKADEKADFALLVDGKIVAAKEAEVLKGTHVLYVENKNGTPKQIGVGKYEAKCLVCGKVMTLSSTNIVPGAALYETTYVDEVIAAGKTAALPTGCSLLQGDWYVISAADAAADKGTSSPKTFDAGIALYVGMSLMSVAGSAVVIGKKKEF